MKKPLLISLAAATILTSSLDAQSMYERIQLMELQMKEMHEELTTLRTQQNALSMEETSSEKEEVVKEEEEQEEATILPADDDTEDLADEASEDESDEEEDEEESIEERITELEESISDLNKATNGSHVKLNIDYRFAVDNLQYTMAGKSFDGTGFNGKDTRKNDAFMSNRLWVNMNYKANDNLSFSSQMAYNKAFGGRSGWGMSIAGMETFDWITNENAYDGALRIRSAYFLYKNDTFMDTDVPWTFSIGRRPSTNGHLVNLRDDEHAASPMGHTINVEFDGLSSKFSFANLTGIDGMYMKICAGRGLTNASTRFFTVAPTLDTSNPADHTFNNLVVNNGAPYSTNEDDIPNIDLYGLIFVPYDNGQYGIATQYYYAHNLIDVDLGYTPYGEPTMQGMKTVGSMHSFTANFTMNGIGDEWSDYLDDTFFFLSAAVSMTDPKDGQRMLYAAQDFQGNAQAAGESKTGYSAWVGVQMPSIISEDGRWGLEYNYGSQYWRSVTYGEDTNIGSKLAARGNAYEIYFTEPLVEDMLSLQIRYTYIDYDYTGSSGFFGDTSGTALSIEDLQKSAAAGAPGMAGYAAQTVDKAQDIRFYLRYRY